MGALNPMERGTELVTINGRQLHAAVTITTDLIDVTPQSENDPDWVHIDAHGHRHRWMTGPDPLAPLTDPQHQAALLPTLRWVQNDLWFCTGCCEDYRDGHYECVSCGDRVTPRTRPTVGKHFIPGLKTVTAEVFERLPLVEVQVTFGDPPQTFRGWVISSDTEVTITGERKDRSRITATGVNTP